MGKKLTIFKKGGYLARDWPRDQGTASREIQENKKGREGVFVGKNSKK